MRLCSEHSGRMRQEDRYRLKASLCYLTRPCIKHSIGWKDSGLSVWMVSWTLKDP